MRFPAGTCLPRRGWNCCAGGRYFFTAVGTCLPRRDLILGDETDIDRAVQQTLTAPSSPVQVREGPAGSSWVERARLPASGASETGQCSLTIDGLKVGAQYAFQVTEPAFFF